MARKPQRIDEDALLRTLQQEELDATTYYDSELANDQAKAMDRYFGRPYNDGSEVPNRSTIVTRDVQDAINWMLPHILRHLSASDELITVDDEGLDDGDQVLTDAAAYLRYIMFNDNPGEQVVHDYLWDGFVTKLGVLRSAWEPPEEETPRTLEGVTVEQLLRYSQDERYEILAIEVDGELPDDDGPMPAGLPPPPGGQPGGLMGAVAGPQPGGLMMAPQPQMMADTMAGPEPTFTVELRRRSHGRVIIEAMAPENFRISRRARSIDTAGYHAGQFEEYLAKIIADYPDRAIDLDPNVASGDFEVSGAGAWSDQRLTSRFGDEADTGVNYNATVEDERKRVVLLVEYIRGDFDRDGLVELRRIKRCGRVILENDIVEESEFSSWSPIRVAHRAVGMSVADTLMDIQRVRTVLTRNAMDGLSQALAPRLLINSMALGDDQSLLDRLLDHEVGDVIPVEGDPRAVAMPLVTPDLSASALNAIEYWDRRSEEASGWSRHNMGIQPQAITDTAKGIENLQAAANARIEQYARWAAQGIEAALNKALRIICRHQDHARVIKVRGKRLRIDPSRWSDEMTARVHVGGVESREKRVQGLGVIAAKQEQILLQLGPSNPLVTLQRYRNTLAKIVSAMGERDPSAYFGEIPEDWQPPAPGPDAKTMEAQAKAQLAQATAEHKAQMDQAKLAHDSKIKEAEFQRDMQKQAAELEAKRLLSAAELEHKRQAAAVQIEADMRMAAQKAENDRALAMQEARYQAELEAVKLAAERDIAERTLASEMELARWRTTQEIALAREKNQAQAPTGDDVDVSDGVRFGGKVG